MIPIQSGLQSLQTAVAGRPAAQQGVGLANAGPDLAEILSDSAEELTQALASKVQERKLKERMASGEAKPEGLSREELVRMLEEMAGDQQAGSDQGTGKTRAEQAVEALGRKVRQQPGLARQHAREQGAVRPNSSCC